MRKKSTFMLVLSAAVFAASVYSLAAAAAYQPERNAATPVAVSSSQINPSRQNPEENFSPKIIKNYNGNVAVFEENEAAPIKILETQTDTLPLETAERLKNGITVFTHDEYLSYLEDFS